MATTRQQLPLKKEGLVCLYDTTVSFFSIPLALYLMLGTEMSDFTVSYLTKLSFVYSLVCCSIFAWFQSYKGLWRFLSLFDTFIIFVAVVVASFLAKPLTLLMSQAEALPGFAMILTSQLTMCLILVPRFFYRLWIERHALKEILLKPVLSKRALIIGDGHLAEVLLNILRYDSKLLPVGVLCKDKEEVGRTFHGLKILATVHELDEALADLDFLKRRPTHLLLLEDCLNEREIALLKKKSKILGLEANVFSIKNLFI